MGFLTNIDDFSAFFFEMMHFFVDINIVFV